MLNSQDKTATVKVSQELLENYSSFYQGDVEEWRRRGAVDKAQNIMALCGAGGYARVIEVGAGNGAVLAQLDSVGFSKELYALEISNSGVERIRERRLKTLTECRIFDGYSIPYSDGFFDLLILTHVVEHVEHPRLLLAEAARVARKVFIEVPLEHTARLPKNYETDAVGHINHYCPITIRYLMQSSGFQVEKQITTNPSLALYQFFGKRRGLIKYAVKQILLTVAPGFATKVFAYHEALLCAKQLQRPS